jgi:uncharacterized glyoxalase superfamily protein PhnB
LSYGPPELVQAPNDITHFGSAICSHTRRNMGAWRWVIVPTTQSKSGVADQFYGDRLGGVEDPFGHTWWISTRKEDLSQQEIERRAASGIAFEDG